MYLLLLAQFVSTHHKGGTKILLTSRSSAMKMGFLLAGTWNSYCHGRKQFCVSIIYLAKTLLYTILHTYKPSASVSPHRFQLALTATKHFFCSSVSFILRQTKVEYASSSGPLRRRT